MREDLYVMVFYLLYKVTDFLKVLKVKILRSYLNISFRASHRA